MGTTPERPEVAVLRRQSSRHTARMADARRGVAAKESQLRATLRQMRAELRSLERVGARRTGPTRSGPRPIAEEGNAARSLTSLDRRSAQRR